LEALLITKTRRSESPALRRQQILDAALAVLAQQGYSEVLLDDVARRAGVAKGTLYLYFKDKQHLYTAVMEGLMVEMGERLRRAMAGETGSPLTKVRAAISETLEFVELHKDFFMQCGQTRSTLCGKKDGEALRQRFDDNLRLIGDQLQAAVKSRELRPHDSLTGGLMVIAMCRMYLMKKVFHGHKPPLRESVDELLDLLLNGLGAKHS
jgi:AcrR family transcriptional regulator